MAKYRQAAKIDENQPEIVKELIAYGMSVEVGHDDIIVGYKGLTFWYEIKTLDVVSKKTGQVMPSKLKESQKTLLATFKGHYKVVWTAQQIIDEVVAVTKSIVPF